MAAARTLPPIPPQGTARAPRNRKRGVKFRNKDGRYPDIFADHWLVESPRRIQYERTMLSVTSQLGSALEDFNRDVAEIPDKYIAKAKSRTKTLMEYVVPRITKLANQVGMKLRGWKYAGSTNDGTQVVLPKEIDLFVLFEKFKFRTETQQPGYLTVPLRRFRKKEGDKADAYRFGRFEGTTYLSSMLVTTNLYEFVERALKNNPQVELLPFPEPHEDRPHIVVTFKNKHRFNLIPATFMEKDEIYLNTRPYAYDVDPSSKKAWRVNYMEKERKLFALLDQADRGVRRKAFKILKALVKVEHTLEGLTSYHVKTVLLHSFDRVVDNSPRWQKDSLDSAFLSLLEDLLEFVRQRNLPHFFIRNHNLLSGMEPRRLAGLESRLAYLVDNHQELLRILQKRNK